MKIVKKAEWDDARRIPEQFKSVDVRRLESILADHKDHSSKALQEIEDWRENGEYDVSFGEALERLKYYLNQMGIK